MSPDAVDEMTLVFEVTKLERCFQHWPEMAG